MSRRQAVHRIKTLSLAISFAFLGTTAQPILAQTDHQAQNTNTKISPINKHTITIQRDKWGVPHVFADDTYGLYYGYGYALAEDRLFQMEMVKRSVNGKVSEVLGSKFIDFDKNSRANFDRQSIEKQIANLTKEDKDVFTGYADGFNAKLKQIMADKTNALPKQFTDFGFEPTPWTAFDVAMLYVGTMAGRYSNSSSEIYNLAELQNLVDEHGEDAGRELFDQIHWLMDLNAPTTVPREESLNLEKLINNSRQTDQVKDKLSRVSKDLLNVDNQQLAARLGVISPENKPTASNLWILGPNKTTDASTILINGPQFGWFAPAYTYSIGLHGAGYDVTGNTPFALPVILFGTNGTVAWGSTAGPLDVNDYYQLKLHPKNPYLYYHDGAFKPMQKRTETIKVKDGKDIKHNIYSTEYGTVTSFDKANNTAYAFKRSWDGHEIQSLMGWLHSTKAQNWDEWLDQAKNVATTINWYYADKNGNIGYVSPGYLPVRPDNQDIRLPAIGDGSMDWLGFRSFEDTPKVLNPKSGYIANWNNQSAPIDAAVGDSSRWTATDRVNELNYRINQQSKFTPKEAWGLLEQTSFADVNARYFIPYILSAAKTIKPQEPAVKEALKRLTNWDQSDLNTVNNDYYDDPGLTIFRTWLENMITNVLKDDIKSVQLGTAFPDSYPKASANIGLGTKLLFNALLNEQAGVKQKYDFFNGANTEQKDEIIIQTLRQTVMELSDKYGTDQSKWLSPASKHKFYTDNFLGVPQAMESETVVLPKYMNRGTQNDMVRFTQDGTVSLCTVAPPGQSAYVAPDGTKSPHYADQLALFENFECKYEYLNKADLDKNTVSITELNVFK